MRTKPTSRERPLREHIGASSGLKPRFPIQRTEIWDHKIKIFGWPSHGGVIVLDNATLVDLEFLGWDTVNPPLKRNRDQDAEDEVCKRLLLLGATWFDSQDRYDIVAAVEDNFDPLAFQIETGEAPPLTKTERRWVKGPGMPGRTAHLLLAKNMDEKCEILKQLGGRYLTSLEDYDGAGCLNAWNEKETGEVGPLVVTRYVEW